MEVEVLEKVGFAERDGFGYTGFQGEAPPIAKVTVTAVNPDEGDQNETKDVVITGTNFANIVSVSFGSEIAVNDFTVDSTTQITANITMDEFATTGARDVTVAAPRSTGILSDGFTVLQADPTLISAVPDEGDQDETLDVVLTGTYLTGATSVDFGAGITVNDYTVDSTTQITANITIASDATPGARDITVVTPGGTAVLSDGFTVVSVAPTVTNVNPNSAYWGDTEEIVITGTNLTGATDVDFGDDITVNDFDVDSATQITANITVVAGADTGARDVSVTTPGGTGTLTDGFTVYGKRIFTGCVQAGSGHIFHTEADYATVHNAASGTHRHDYLTIGQRVSDGWYRIYRGAYQFATGAYIPAGSTILSAIIEITLDTDLADTPFTIHIVNGDDLEDSLVNADYGDLLDDITSFGSLTSADVVAGYYANDITLSSDFYDKIAKGSGNTKMAFRSANDIDSVLPTGNEYILFKVGIGFRFTVTFV